jgi:TolB-like protein/DNA-binding winged helix-turn-helix (wHTH) protein/Flp pilus assembly protein TadD
VVVTVYEFGDFKLDCDRFELYRSGRPVKLERKPMELLILLAAKNGHLVTRAEIAERLWDREVFVDTEHGINTAIRKIRQVIEDDPEDGVASDRVNGQPRFLFTVTGKGYRFVAVPVVVDPAVAGPAEEKSNGSGRDGSPTSGPEIPIAPLHAIAPSKPPANSAAAPGIQTRFYRPLMMALVALCLLAGAAIALNLGGVRDLLFTGNRVGPIHSIAVLPLSNLSGDASQDYFADGMTDELITALAQNHSLRVISRTSAMQYKGVNRPLRDIARELGVDGIVEGSINRSADRVHINLQLIHAPTDTHVWAQSYDRDLNGALALPQEVSQIIATRAKIGTAPEKPQRYINPEAHDAYLHGRYLWFAANDFDESKKYFEKAIQLQPDYAAAWDGLGDNYSAMVVSERLPPQEGFPKAEAAVRKALELDDSLPEVHNSMAAIYFFDKWDWQRADAESRRAIELNPNYAEARYIHAYILLALNRDHEALEEQKRSTEIDPFERPEALGEAYNALRQYDAAINDLQLRVQAQPTDVFLYYGLSHAYWLKGMWKESEDELEKALSASGDVKKAAAYRAAFERGGEEAVERLGVEEAKKRVAEKQACSYQLASAYAYAGEKEQALKYLESAYRDRCPGIVFLTHDAIFDFVSSDPRYLDLVKKIGLVPWSEGAILRH